MKAVFAFAIGYAVACWTPWLLWYFVEWRQGGEWPPANVAYIFPAMTAVLGLPGWIGLKRGIAGLRSGTNWPLWFDLPVFGIAGALNVILASAILGEVSGADPTLLGLGVVAGISYRLVEFVLLLMPDSDDADRAEST